MNTRPTTKAELLSATEAEYTAFRAALEGLDARQLTEVWLGTWSVKDIVALISGWHRELGPALERMARGDRPVPEGTSSNDVDAWRQVRRGADGGPGRPGARRVRALARGLYARRGGGPTGTVRARENRVENR